MSPRNVKLHVWLILYFCWTALLYTIFKDCFLNYWKRKKFNILWVGLDDY